MQKKTVPLRPTVNTKVPAPTSSRPTTSRLSPVTATLVKFKRRKKAPLLNLPKKGSKRRPAFDAFEIKRDVDNGMGKTVRTIEVVAPETGIHSQAWALQIQPQDTPLLQIPLEIRTRIFEMLFRSYDLILSPRKNGKGFVNTDDGLFALRRIINIPPCKDLTKTHIKVALICRQIYVEVAGGALLYRMSEFYFKSSLLMKNYLSKINPFHVSSITSVHLCLRLAKSSPTVPKTVTQILATIQSLKHISLTLYIDHSICDSRFLPCPMGKQLVLKEDICTKIESSKNWKVLKGLKDFEMRFQELNPSPRLGIGVNLDSPRFVAMREEIRKVVMRVE